MASQEDIIFETEFDVWNAIMSADILIENFNVSDEDTKRFLLERIQEEVVEKLSSFIRKQRTEEKPKWSLKGMLSKVKS